MAQGVLAAETYLFNTVLPNVFPAAAINASVVSMGELDDEQPPNQIRMLGYRDPITRPTLGTGRSREHDVEFDIELAAFAFGGNEAQPLASAAARGMLDLLEAYFRTSPNEKLGGACWDSWVSNADMAYSTEYQTIDDPQAPGVPVGRWSVLTVTVTTRIRI
jgi:hypothetical protein